MLNRDIYTRAPETTRLANNGVAEVSEDRSDAAMSVLREELESFVCDGQYEKGLAQILETFLGNLGRRAEQPGVWISGFYGSGKSHLAKMLRALWTDLRFADGATARGLAHLPDEVVANLKELSTQGKRHGGLHAAAGKLGAGAGDNVRLALLGLVFKSKGLPEHFAQAQFVRWLKREGLIDAVSGELATAGRSLPQELPHLYVSAHLARAVMAARPGFADTELAARQFIKATFPQVIDVTNDQMVSAIEDVLTESGRFPLTLVVLDEVQQYIGNDARKAYAVQELTETLCKHFNGLLLFVGTGQSALSGMPNLMRLMARFPISVLLGDWDVENVTRKIILAKKPSAIAEVDNVWRTHLGEISRHLRGTKLEHVTDDEAVLTSDYPILPVRRRFWERVLRHIDTTGTVAQLRSQLRVVHEAVLATADQPLGHVVAADFLYDQIAANLLSTALLSKEVFETVERLLAGDERSRLKARLLKLIYLVNKLPAETATDLGLRATSDVLADLLMTDLSSGSHSLRAQLPALLEELQNADRLIMAIQGASGAEFRLQTRESSTWYDEFRAQEAELKSAPQRIELQRADLLKERFNQVFGKVRVTQGKSNEPRKLSLIFDEILPKDHARSLYVWVQDGWQADEKSVVAEARAKGTDNPTIFVFLPAQHKTDIANALVALEAAKSTLRRRGTPSTIEGQDAQRSMETRQRNAERELASLLDRVFASVRVFQGGGQEVADGIDLADRVSRAAKASVVRLFPDFDVSDHEKWDKVLEEARKGNLEALRAVNHLQEPEKHPVCQKLLGFIAAGKRGGEIRDHFDGSPFGWSRDVIDGALFALLATGALRCTDAAGRAVDVKSLDRNKLTQASFRQESINITAPQKIKIRTLLTTLGIPCPPNEELTRAPQLIARLRELAKAAGGPAPAPDGPKDRLLSDLDALSGNAVLLEIYSHADDILKVAEQWRKTGEAIERRLPPWQQLVALLAHARTLGPYADLKAEVDAIVAQRALLAEPDPVRPLLDRTLTLLRQALNAKHEAYADAFEQKTAELEADLDWSKLTPTQRTDLSAKHHLQPLIATDLSTPEQVQDSLDAVDLAHWLERIAAVPARFDAARHAAIQLLKPNTIRVQLPRRTLQDAADVRAWLLEAESMLMDKIQKGPVAL
jgi:hypothetical protein